MEILDFITALRESDEYIKVIYSQGGCYRFYLLLARMYEGCKPMLTEDKDHVVVSHDGKMYDIYGECKDTHGLSVPTEKEIKEMESWSFGKRAMLVIEECPYCGTPICVDSKGVVDFMREMVC